MVYAAAAVVPGNAHESPVLYQLVEDFVAAVGPGVLKWFSLGIGDSHGPRSATADRSGNQRAHSLRRG